MEKTVLSFGFAAAAMFVWIATSWAYTINDNYIGAAPTHASYWGADVVGRDCFFDVDRMEVNYSQGEMTVDIYSRYFNNIGRYGTEMGDLFISTDGWSPVSPTRNDYYYGDYSPAGGTSETWEFAVALDDHLAEAGEFSLHAIDNGAKDKNNPSSTGDIILSNINIPGHYRAGQEVQVDSTDLPVFGSGEWVIHNLHTAVDTDDYLRMAIPWIDQWNGVSEFGFHWGLTCGNDVIEGSAPAPVPEPGTMLLLGCGLVCLAGFGGKRFRKK